MGRNAYARHRGCYPNAVTEAAKHRIREACLFAGDRLVGVRWRLADELWARNTDPGAAEKTGTISSIRASAVSGAEGVGANTEAAHGTERRTPGDTDRQAAMNSTPSVRGRIGEKGEAQASPSSLADPTDSGDQIVTPAAGLRLVGDHEGETAVGSMLSHAPGFQLAGDGESEMPAGSITIPGPGYQDHRTKRERHLADLAELEYLERVGALVSAAEVEREVAEIFTKLKSGVMRLITKNVAQWAAETDPARLERLATKIFTQEFDEQSRALADDAAGGVEERAAALP